MCTGGCGRSAARSADVTTMAMPPFDTMQQSSRCSGRATHRDAWWSASVIGSRNRASGFFVAHARWPTAIAPSCSLVVPKRFMWRWAASA